MTMYNYLIGTSLLTMTNLEELDVPIAPPKSTYSPGVEKVHLGSGKFRWLGSPVAEWRWGFLTQAQRDQLRTFCPGTSSIVYIQTRVNDQSGDPPSDYQIFQAVMEWPNEDKDAGRRLDFVIRFTSLIPQSGP